MGRIKIDLPTKCIGTFDIPIRITDINYGDHVGNDSLVAIIHEARMQFLRAHNFTELEIAGTSLIMSELVVEFKNESFYGDVLEVRIFPGEISRVSFELFYSLAVARNQSTITIANAKTAMVCFNYKEKKVEAVPQALKDILLS